MAKNSGRLKLIVIKSPISCKISFMELPLLIPTKNPAQLTTERGLFFYLSRTRTCAHEALLTNPKQTAPF